MTMRGLDDQADRRAADMRKKTTPFATRGSRFAALTATGLAALVLNACAGGDPSASAADWRRSHDDVDRALMRTVNWPGTRVSRVEGDAHGFRTVLKFPGDDSDMGAIALVEPAGTNPCAAVPYLVADTGGYQPDPSTYGATDFASASCTPVGTGAWQLVSYPHQGDPWTGYAERRDGVMLILTTYDDWTDPDFKAIAATMHALDDRQLGSLL
ncbi:hypothetical protein NMG29_30090 [Streptomyces cocklensis]|uniref:hypothetical protein n=1 Tax=Actinacidiphila cocklensis TaxID=887465 RepID=UPI00203E9865|nr:hypothetical protein [Actinacidiphila cocklensis]MDD1062425.1 hypothetical protein [Actinacidiphila cocklensis]WSX72555.1 hypothetical protein OH826_00945 [Streptomyces sp. NBC_00899]WSX81376.1 hypothetical protein OH826_50550 [Streptomyces sp. NBC_00899]